MLQLHCRATQPVSDVHSGDDLLTRLLRARGIRDAAAREAFLHPSMDALHDPFQLNDMREAVEQLKQAIAAGARICVYGDYDVDGVCATAILTEYLRSVGATVEPYLPSRHNEGYGLNDTAIYAIAQRFDVLVTVDCGITAVSHVAAAQALGVTVIVTDHHHPESQLPDCPCVNPLLGDYPYRSLCGAGVAFKLVCAMGGLAVAMRWIDYAALATIADIVPLTGENRVIAWLGIEQMNGRARTGVAALIEVAGLTGKTLAADHVAFQLTPRLNAAGRMGEAIRAYRLLISDDPHECQALANELNEENIRRKAMETQIMAAAEQTLRDQNIAQMRILLLVGESWNPGVIGLAASRLVEKYHYPTIVFTRNGDTLTGSARSIDGIDIHETLTHVATHVVRFGGHRLAAGVTLTASAFPAFAQAIQAYLAAHVDPAVYVPSLDYDLDVGFDELTPDAVNALNALAPMGCGNPYPVFRTQVRVLNATAVGQDGVHARMRLADEADGTSLDAIWFRHASELSTLAREGVEAVYTPKINDYMGRVSVQAEIKCMRNPGLEAILFRSEAEETQAFQSFLTCTLYNSRKFAEKTAFEPDRYPAIPQPLTFEQLASVLHSNVQGTLVIAASTAAARRICQAMPTDPPDVYVGRYPDDPRAFNAVCVCPIGACPQGYERVVVLDLPTGLIPAHYVVPQPISVRFADLPDVDGLRDIYRALRKMDYRPYRFQNVDALARDMAERMAISPVAVAAGLMVLECMHVIEITVRADTVRVTRLPVVKTDPSQNALFEQLTRFRRWALARDAWPFDEADANAGRTP